MFGGGRALDVDERLKLVFFLAVAEAGMASDAF